MKHGSNPRRGRSRGNGKRHPASRSQNFESSGPDVKIRGTAQQVQEKYLNLARDAFSAGDRIAAEGYYQHAEHYFRLATSAMSAGADADQNRNQRTAQMPPPSMSASPFDEDNGPAPADMRLDDTIPPTTVQPRPVDVPVIAEAPEAAPVTAPEPAPEEAPVEAGPGDSFAEPGDAEPKAPGIRNRSRKKSIPAV